MKKTFALIFFSFIFIFVSCERQTQADEVLIVQGLGIDLEDDEFLITFQCYDTAQTDGKATPKTLSKTITTVVGEGDTIEDALTNIQINSGEEIFLGHCELVILNEDIFGEKFSEVVKHFSANRDYLLSLEVVTSKDKCEDILSFNRENDRFSTKKSVSILQESEKNEVITSKKLIDLLNDVYNCEKEITIPLINIDEKGQVSFRNSIIEINAF